MIVATNASSSTIRSTGRGSTSGSTGESTGGSTGESTGESTGGSTRVSTSDSTDGSVIGESAGDSICTSDAGGSTSAIMYMQCLHILIISCTLCGFCGCCHVWLPPRLNGPHAALLLSGQARHDYYAYTSRNTCHICA